MTQFRANTFQANRGDRLGCYVFDSCPPPPPGGQARTAPVGPPPATGAGEFMQDGEAASRLVHTQETAGASPAPATSSCARAVGRAAQATAPAVNPKPPATAGAVILSEASAFVLSLVAAHQGRSPEDVVALLVAGAAEAIGIHSLILRDADQVDLADLPDFAMRAANRFRGGGP